MLFLCRLSETNEHQARGGTLHFLPISILTITSCRVTSREVETYRLGAGSYKPDLVRQVAGPGGLDCPIKERLDLYDRLRMVRMTSNRPTAKAVRH